MSHLQNRKYKKSKKKIKFSYFSNCKHEINNIGKCQWKIIKILKQE
jgi:hypothetical protein